MRIEFFILILNFYTTESSEKSGKIKNILKFKVFYG